MEAIPAKNGEVVEFTVMVPVHVRVKLATDDVPTVEHVVVASHDVKHPGLSNRPVLNREGQEVTLTSDQWELVEWAWEDEEWPAWQAGWL